MRFKTFGLLLLFSVMICLSALAQQSQPVKPSYVLVTKYDPARNAAKDLAEAVVEAQRTQRRIILDVGGEWCSWCHALDRFIASNAEINTQLEQNFVLLKINFGPENQNKTFLSKYPAIPGYPHLYILDTDGKLLHSQDTSYLEKGKSYDPEKFLALLKKWSPKKPESGELRD